MTASAPASGDDETMERVIAYSIARSMFAMAGGDLGTLTHIEPNSGDLQLAFDILASPTMQTIRNCLRVCEQGHGWVDGTLPEHALRWVAGDTAHDTAGADDHGAGSGDVRSMADEIARLTRLVDRLGALLMLSDVRRADEVMAMVIPAATEQGTVPVAAKDNLVRHEPYAWARDDEPFMTALGTALRSTRFIMAAGGMSAERIHVIWDTIAATIERGAT